MDKLRKIVKEYRGHDDWAEHEYLDGLVGSGEKLIPFNAAVPR